MKYALILGLVLLVVWLWKSNRQAQLKDQKKAAPPPERATPGKLTEVVACAVCHVHLPRHEALTGSRGLYCSAEHRQQAGD